MEIRYIDDSACIKYDVNTTKITDRFTKSGKIGWIGLTVKSNSIGNKMKMTIGDTVLTDNELIDKNSPYHPEGKIVFSRNGYMESAIGKDCIKFKQGDLFEFEQPSDNISEIELYFMELEK